MHEEILQSDPLGGQDYDANQTMPTQLDETRVGTGMGLKRHANIEFHSSFGEKKQEEEGESLGSQLERVTRSGMTSLGSLAGLFDVDLGELEAAENERKNEGESETSEETYYPAHC